MQKISIREIQKLLKIGESQQAEFKESFHSAQDISKVMAAFANTLGGTVLIGIDDKGRVIGLKGSIDKLQQEVSSAAQSISPAPLISVERHQIDGKQLLSVIVQQPSDQIYHTFHGAIYVRVGSTNRRLDGATHLEYLRHRQILSFDESFDSLATLKDLDIHKIKAYLEARGQEAVLKSHGIEKFLISNRLADSDKSLRIKNSTLLLFAKNPVHFIPQAEIKVVQFAGSEPIEIISHQLIQTDLGSAIDQATEFVRSHISKRIQITSTPRREEYYEFPLPVIREMVINAVAHRDYFSKDSIQISLFDNRIEVANPGSLVQGLTRELFGLLSVRRNPIIYRILRDMGYIEGLGTGIPKMKDGMRKAGLPEPEFVISDWFFRVILYKKPKPVEISDEDLTPRQRKAIEYLKKNTSINTATYAKLNKISLKSAVTDINDMATKKYLKKIGEFRGAYYVLRRH